MLNRTLIVSVFIVASCGLAYELIAGALSSYLLGDSVLQFSSIIGCYLFAMGVGSHLSKYIRDEVALKRFIEIELLVGLLGGISATLLFVVFAWMSGPFRSVLYAMVFVIGVLVGMEIPLVMRVLNQKQAEFAELVSRVLTFDYLGALAVSLLFPLLLAPKLGLARSAALFGLSNVAVALFTCWRFRAELTGVRALVGRALGVFAILGITLAYADQLTRWAERGLFGDEIVYAATTPYQRLVITRWQDDTRLYINGNLQFSSRDEHRYHEALVHPGLAALPGAQRVLIMGGGDGLALREVLKYPNIKSVTLVDLDPEMTGLFRRNAQLVALNRNAFADPRVKVINADAAQWLEQQSDSFDFIISDFPDPTSFGLGKLYSVPFYRLVLRHLSERGLLVVQSTSPYYAPRAYWTVNATLRAVGLHTRPYHAYVPSFGEWGYILAARQPGYQPPRALPVATRYLDASTLPELFRFPRDMQPLVMPPNQLNNQSLVHAFEQDWQRVIR